MGGRNPDPLAPTMTVIPAKAGIHCGRLFALRSRSTIYRTTYKACGFERMANGRNYPDEGLGGGIQAEQDNMGRHRLTPCMVLVESAGRAKRGAGDALYLRSPSRA